MATVGDMEVQINASLVEDLNKAYALEVNYLADIARLWRERDKLRAERDALTTLAAANKTQREFVAELHFQVSRFANQKEAAQAWGVSESYLSDVLSGWRAPGEKICKAVGYERVMMFGRVQP